MTSQHCAVLQKHDGTYHWRLLARMKYEMLAHADYDAFETSLDLGFGGCIQVNGRKFILP